MKFDLDTAWKDTTAMLRDTVGLLAIIAGVFYFVPYAAGMLWIPGLSDLLNGGFDPASEAAKAKVNALFAGYWWAFILLTLVQGIGFLAMLTLLRRRSSPTVGQAIQMGVRSILSYLAASILLGLAVGFIVLVIGLVIALTGIAALQIIAVGLTIAIICYMATKFSMSAPVIAIDGTLNPLDALGNSWTLTKGNSFRLFGFYALLMLAYVVISALLSMIFALIFALGGAETQVFGQAITGSLMNAAAAILFACVLAAVHAQLSRLRAPPAKPVEGED